jgi:hypothetical protein
MAHDHIAGDQTSVLVFPALNAFVRHDEGATATADDRDVLPTADFFASSKRGNLQFLGEFLLSEDEADVERAQIGWSFGNDSVWLGRVHNPLGIWNTEFHHGGYMQTSVTRPPFAEFEDSGGVLPVHSTGLLITGERPVASHALAYDLVVGLGPEYVGDAHALEAFDVVRPHDVDAGHVVALRAGYKPDPVGDSQVGGFLGAWHIPAESALVTDLNLSVAGAYTNWAWDQWRLIGELYYGRTTIRETGGFADHSSMIGGFVQAQHAIGPKWTPFVRIDFASESSGEPYFDLFPQFIRERVLGGVRWDFRGQQALKLEVGRAERSSGRSTEVRLQWSAFLP